MRTAEVLFRWFVPFLFFLILVSGALAMWWAGFLAGREFERDARQEKWDEQLPWR